MAENYVDIKLMYGNIFWGETPIKIYTSSLLYRVNSFYFSDELYMNALNRGRLQAQHLIDGMETLR